jgi:sterol desaturase/sphingolipid hydroxylase (fatty acid hydroxylase superfamily)
MSVERPVAIAAIAGLLVVLITLENVLPLRRRTRPLGPRLVVNVTVAAAALATAFAIVAPVATTTVSQVAELRFGLLQWFAMPPALQFVLGLLLMDLSFYAWHLANHKVPFLWRFHNAHHIDPDLDVSTAYRFHFGEVALSALFRIAQVGVIGVPLHAFAVYELIFHANTLFQHSNVRLPVGVERWLNLILVTPRMHGIHHSEIRAENNSNFSVVFSWWDRLLGTIRLNVPQERVAIGIAGYRNADDNAIGNVLALPFRAQRDYWRRQDGTLALTRETPSNTTVALLAA